MTNHLNLSSTDTQLLWIKAGGRCEKCNRILYRDAFDKAFEYPIADRAHIIAQSPGGARGDTKQSKKLAQDINNVLLLCPSCHREIDRNKKRYSEDFLNDMKINHEIRIEYLTSFTPDKWSHVVTCVFDVNGKRTPISNNMAYEAVINNGYFPVPDQPIIELGAHGHPAPDSQEAFWKYADEALCGNFEKYLSRRIQKDGDIQHLSIFGFAPIPILIKFGQLLTDKANADVFQLHRDPQSWIWRDDETDLGFKIIPPEKSGTNITLLISLSDTISDEDVIKTLGTDVELWKLTIDNPDNKCIKSQKHLNDFKTKIKEALREIKRMHGTGLPIHVFPAMPISTAIEFGRIWMPKADLNLIIYDRNRNNNLAFEKALTIGE